MRPHAINSAPELLPFETAIPGSRTTKFRWRESGWIRTVTIGGKLFVTRQELERFLARAEAGEFALPLRGAAMSKSKARAIRGEFKDGGVSPRPPIASVVTEGKP